MTQPSKENKLPPDALERNDHDLMETIFGTEIMTEVDKVVEERSKDPKKGRVGECTTKPALHTA